MSPHPSRQVYCCDFFYFQFTGNFMQTSGRGEFTAHCVCHSVGFLCLRSIGFHIYAQLLFICSGMFSSMRNLNIGHILDFSCQWWCANMARVTENDVIIFMAGFLVSLVYLFRWIQRTKEIMKMGSSTREGQRINEVGDKRRDKTTEVTSWF